MDKQALDDKARFYCIEASNKFQETLLIQFNELSPTQRAELIEIGFETLAKLYQHYADKVAGK